MAHYTNDSIAHPHHTDSFEKFDFTQEVNAGVYAELGYRAEGYGAFYSMHHPGDEFPLSGEWADGLTESILLQCLGLTESQADDIRDSEPDLVEYVITCFDEGLNYREVCTCSHWSPGEHVAIAEASQCPAHDDNTVPVYRDTVDPEEV